jgi:hypothetical protein
MWFINKERGREGRKEGRKENTEREVRWPAT